MRILVTCLAVVLLGGCSERFDVDGSRLMARVVTQVSFGPRVPGSEGHLAMRQWLVGELRAMGGTVEEQTFADSSLGRPLELTNVIARFGPERGRRLMLCAHYDTRPWSDQEPDSAKRSLPIAGANDGGSGVAVLMEVGELLKRTPPAVGVDLVFFDGEDMGRPDRPDEYSLGAKGYARRLPPAGTDARPVAAILFDMVGDRDLQIHPEVNSTQRAASLAALVLEAARATGARSFRSEPRYTLVDDHIPLLDAGLPAVDVIDFDYPAWHTQRDTPDQVSAESLAEVARVAAWLVLRSPLARP